MCCVPCAHVHGVRWCAVRTARTQPSETNAHAELSTQPPARESNAWVWCPVACSSPRHAGTVHSAVEEFKEAKGRKVKEELED